MLIAMVIVILVPAGATGKGGPHGAAPAVQPQAPLQPQQAPLQAHKHDGGGAGRGQGAQGNGPGNGNDHGAATSTAIANAAAAPSGDSQGGKHDHGNGHGNGTGQSTGPGTAVTPVHSPPVTVPTPVATPASASTPVPSTPAVPASPIASPTVTAAPTVTPAGTPASVESPSARLVPFPGSRTGLPGSGGAPAIALAPGGIPLLGGAGAIGLSGGGTPTLTGTVGPGTTLLNPGGGGKPATTASHSSGRSTDDPSSPATVIEHFINIIPTGVWIGLFAALAMATLATGAAVASSRRARRRLGEVAAVTTVASTDALTGLLNRRGFSEAVERELKRAHRYAHPLALAFIDVRGLKAVNDSQGHLAGDRLLRDVARLLSDSARTYDVVGRIGGDEMAILLPEQSAAGAAALADRIRANVPDYRAELGLNASWDLTIGTSVFPDDGEDFEQLLATADRRLYEQRGIYIR